MFNGSRKKKWRQKLAGIMTFALLAVNLYILPAQAQEMPAGNSTDETGGASSVSHNDSGVPEGEAGSPGTADGQISAVAESTASETKHIFDVAALTGAQDNEEIAEGTTFAEGYFKTVGTVKKRIKAGTTTVTSVEVAKDAGSEIQFTVAGTADVTVVMSSTGGSNTSAVGLVDASGNAVENQEQIAEVTGTAKTTLTYTGLTAGTYKVLSPQSAYGRGARVYSITVDDIPAVTTTEYLFDVAALTGAQDNEEIAEGTTFGEGYFKTVGTVKKRVKAGTTTVTSVEVAKNAGSGIQFTVTGTADVTVVMSSTGGSNTSAVGLVDASGNAVGNQEQIAEVAGTAKTTLTYTGLEAGTYKVLSPQSAYGRGARVYSIHVVQTSGGSRPPRADWSLVAAPVITSAAVDGTNAAQIIVAFDMIIGYDGADSVSVSMKDASGKVAGTQSYGRDGESGSVTFKPGASGTYTFTAVAARKDEEDKTSNEVTVADFKLPLTAPNVKSATSQGSGSVLVKWDAVLEAEKYLVTVAGTAVSIETDKLEALVTGLTVGSTYTISVTAVRGSEQSKAGSIEATATADAQREWAFAAFGSGVDTKNNGYEGNASDGSVRVYSNGGKGKLVPGSTDGLAFYYTKIDPAAENFTLTATARVNTWTLSNGQEGFGLMVADRVGKHGDNSTFWNNSYMASVTKVEYSWDGEKVSDTGDKISMKLGVGSQEKTGVTLDNITPELQLGDMSVFVTQMTTLDTSCAAMGDGTYNIVGGYKGTEPTGTIANPLTEFTLTIQKNNTGYFVSYTDGEGKTTTKKYYDTEALNHLDESSVYVGFFASRNADITFENISLTTIDPAQDAPAEERPVTKVTPKFEILSANIANTADYEMVYQGNADGQLTIADEAGNVLLDRAVLANEKVRLNVALNAGENRFAVRMVPNPDYRPSQNEVLSSYDPVEFVHTVNMAASDSKIVYIGPNAGADGSPKLGTRENPTDIYSAVSAAVPGQQLILLEGTYDLDRTVVVERGINGTESEKIYLIGDPDGASRPVLSFGGKCAGMILAGDYWYFKGFDVTGSADAQKGIQVAGDHNTLDHLKAYRNGNTGIQISRYKSTDEWEDWPSYNLILNCSSYLNADKGYEDADGFAAKLTIADGNVFDGCIAAYNADDGWDLFAKVQSGTIGKVVIRNCIAFKNGYILDENGNEVNAGNGNGFKMGGDSLPGGHTLINSIAFGNKAKGVDSNSCPDIKVQNVTSFNNESYNVAFYTNNAANTDFGAQGLISFKDDKGTSEKENIKPKGSQDNGKIYGASNYYRETAGGKFVNSDGAEVKASWFVSLDMDRAMGEITRNADGSINMHGFLELTAEAPADAGARFADTVQKTVIGNGISEDVLTDEIKSATGCGTAAELSEYMKKNVSESDIAAKLLPGVKTENMALMDIRLQISQDGGATWSDLTAENFPSTGVWVTIPYPEGTNGSEYNFVVGHLITMSSNGRLPGTMEYFAPIKKADGLTIHIYSASPFVIAWDKIIQEPDDPGNQEPDDPGNQEPDDPGNQEPDDPGNQEPDNPGNQEPGKPDDSDRDDEDDEEDSQPAEGTAVKSPKTYDDSVYVYASAGGYKTGGAAVEAAAERDGASVNWLVLVFGAAAAVVFGAAVRYSRRERRK